MKVEIVTIISNNYGNRLQNYALQETLKKLGVRSVTNRIDNKIAKRKVKEIIKATRSRYLSDYFSRFDMKNIKFKYSIEKYSDSKYIDYYIAGSDQIWNPNFSFNSDREFLTFAPSNKKIAYAASIGISELSENQSIRFKRNLKDFCAISVRETEAADLIEKLIGKRPEVVLDPTMLLTKDEWFKVSKQSKLMTTKPFIVKYFLGRRSEEVDEMINSFANENEFEVIDVTSKECPYIIGPAEFVYLFQYSQMNFVDSFHGTVFSILFNKTFYTFARPEEKGFGNMNSRFETLFSLFPLEERYLKKCDKINFDAEINFDITNKLLESYRSESVAFLKKALGV